MKKIRVYNVMNESLQLINGLKWPVFWLFLSCAAMFLVTAFISIILVYSLAKSPDSQRLVENLVIFTLMNLYIYIYFVIITMLGVRQSIGLPVSVKKTISQCIQSTTQLFYAFIFFGLLTVVNKYLNDLNDLGLSQGIEHTLVQILLLLFVCYFSLLMYAYLIPLLITRKCNVMFAISYGMKKINANAGPLIVCELLMFIITVISSIPLGIGLILAMPMYCVMHGILFRETCDLEKDH